MRFLILGLLFLLSLALPGTVFYFWSWAGIKPDLVMLLVIYIALHMRRRPAVLWGLSLGLLEDLYLGRYLGMYGFTMMAVAFLTQRISERWSRDNFFLTIVLVFFMTMAGQLMIGFFGVGAGLRWSLEDISRLAVGVALYNALLVPITYPLIHRSFLHGWLRYRPKYER